MAQPRALPALGIADPHVGGVCAGEGASDKPSPRHGAQSHSGFWITDHVAAKGHAHIPLQFPDQLRHGRHGLQFRMQHIRHAELVGKMDAVDPSLLKSQHIRSRCLINLFHTAVLIVEGISRQRQKMAQPDQRFVRPKHILNPISHIRSHLSHDSNNNSFSIK